MKLTTGILAMALMTSGSWAAAQNPDAIDNARSTAKSLQQKQSNTSPAVAPAKAKPAPGAPAPAIKPAAIPSSKPDAAPKSTHNQLQKVNVVKAADSVQIEISSSQPVTPRLSTLKSPNRLLVEFPETVVASSQNKIAVGSAGVKGVRVGMDGKTPPTTSVVIDLEKELAYDLTPGAAGKVILTLHAQGAAPSVAKNSPAPVKAAPAAAPKAATPVSQPQVAGKPAAVPTKVAVAKGPVVVAPAPASKPDPKQQTKVAPAPVKIAAPVAKGGITATKIAAPAAAAPAPVVAKAAPAPKPEVKKWAMSGKRDPFFSPVVQENGSGCSTGKKCLEIGNINLRGVVKSDNGFIAVVTNNLNKAYFLRENDPVFNGYVVKITGDSVVFQETIQDKLGKSFTREVVKKIFTPAV